MGICQNDLGIRTDLLDACPKAEGMMMLVRSMGPQVIAVDEIGSMEEVRMLQYAMCCGCQMIATVHGASYHEIRGKPMFDLFFSEKLFQRYVVMEWDGRKVTLAHFTELPRQRGLPMQRHRCGRLAGNSEGSGRRRGSRTVRSTVKYQREIS